MTLSAALSFGFASRPFLPPFKGLSFLWQEHKFRWKTPPVSSHPPLPLSLLLSSSVPGTPVGVLTVLLVSFALLLVGVTGTTGGAPRTLVVLFVRVVGPRRLSLRR